MKKIYLFLCLLTSYHFAAGQAGSLDPSFGVEGIEKIKYNAKGPLVSDKGESYRFELKQNSISTTVKVYKYFSNGTPDLSYGTIETTFPFVMKLFNTALFDDGKVLLVGSVQDFRIGDYIVVARFNLDGSLDFYNTKKRFYSSGYLIPAKLIKQGDQIILFSYFALADVTQPTGQDYIDVFSSSGDGSYTISPWRTRSQYYAPNLSTYSLQKNIAIGRSNVIVAGPEANQIPLPPLWPLPDYGYYISKYGSGGNPDLTFGTNGKIPYPNIGDSRYMLIDDNEKLLVANTVANPVTGNNDFRVIRFNKDGSFDQTFNGTGIQTTDFGGDDSPNSIVVHDGKIIVAGVTTNTITGEKQFAIARYNDDGTLDNSFSEDGKQTLGEAGNAYLLDQIKIKDNKLLALGTAVSSTGDSAKVTAAYLLTVPNPPVCTATGSILREYWANVSGTLISDIPVNTTPSSTSQLSSFEAPTDIADNYGQRIRGYICAPATGNYTFYISGDDESELWLSNSDNPADKRKIASVGGMQWTNPREWTKFESQKSVTIFLQANTKYYIEALNKEGAGGDNLAVGWITPGAADIAVTSGSVLSPFTGTTNPPVCTATGSILREYWANVSGILISDIPINTTPSSTSQLNSFEAPTDIADNYAQRIRGYICAPATGNYTFYISGDDESELWLSTSDNPADKRKIAFVGGMQWTNPRQWTKFDSQKSVTIFLQANTKYYIEALNKEGAGGDNLAVGWITPGSADITVIPGSVLSPFTGTTTNPPVCTATGSILREYWANVSGTLVSDIPVNTTPSSTSQLNSFEAPTDIADNYGQRIRGYICAPATGNYTFYISGDDESELWLSNSDNPADKRKIAFVGGMQWTNPREWTKFDSQKSVTIFLQANTKYYIEALNKEGAGGDNLAVGWVIPGSSDIRVIPGSVLSPYTGTSSQSLNVTISNPAITSNSLRKVADDVNNTQFFLKALPNPTSTHFTINIKSSKSEPVDLKVLDAVGRVIETKRKVSANGSVIIGDHYHTGIYYLQAVQGSERATLKLIKGGF